MEWTQKLKPGVPKYWLQLTAGLMWTCVGIFLISLALEWIIAPGQTQIWQFWGPGIILAFLIYKFGFSKLARKNSRRIQTLEADKPCLFAFQKWHSYPLVIFMIGLGITLRKFSPIPKPLLGILYIGIGGGLGSASFSYYQQVYKNLFTGKTSKS
ncbi:MAG: hypothetical protein HQ574_01795 [Chloroflexi bacterium]|nr:hypothetical protein [Chloroflexota bacterium]